jgi:hypothetical protein
MATTTTMDALRRQHAADFALATRDHAFLKDVGAGTITPARFNTWLAQDYLFVRAFGRMLAATIARCPDSDLLTLIGGLAAIDAELNWFIAKAKERGIDLAATGARRRRAVGADSGSGRLQYCLRSSSVPHTHTRPTTTDQKQNKNKKQRQRASRRVSSTASSSSRSIRRRTPRRPPRCTRWRRRTTRLGPASARRWRPTEALARSMPSLPTGALLMCVEALCVR